LSDEHPPADRIAAIGFDLGETLIYFDGVPLSWQSLYREALIGVADACDLRPAEEHLREAEAVLARYNGRLNPRVVEITTEEVFGGILDALGSSCGRTHLAAEAFFRFFLRRRELYGDTIPALEELRALGLPMGILTDVPYGMPRTIAARMVDGIEPYFDTWLTSVEAGYCKPDPRGLHALAERLGVAPAEMVYIGNEVKDIKAAKAAGMFAVLVNRTGEALNYGEDARVSSLLELLPSLRHVGLPGVREW
jgi:putative hydrolase of the HAD superfamily